MLACENQLINVTEAEVKSLMLGSPVKRILTRAVMHRLMLGREEYLQLVCRSSVRDGLVLVGT